MMALTALGAIVAVLIFMLGAAVIIKALFGPSDPNKS